MRKSTLIVILVAISLFSLLTPYFSFHTGGNGLIDGQFDKADIAFMLTSSALVLIMTPGLGFFYGGMVQKKNVISTILQSFIAMGIITVIWIAVGFGLAFGPSIGGIIGNPLSFLFFSNVDTLEAWPLMPTVPVALFAVFQMKFAIISPALISGAFAERVRFWAYILFISLFSVFIYCPLAHAVWHPDGILYRYGIVDFAGGLVVHMSAGWAAFAGAIFLKQRKEPIHQPSRISYVILGTSLLWFGWFGFNAGSAGQANILSVQAFLNTTVASAAAAVAWGFIEKIRGKKISAMGVCIGAVVGLVAITPAAGYVTAAHSIFIGIASAAVSALMVKLRTRTSIDDTLDVFPCHGVGGITGMLLTGVFANPAINSSLQEPGLFFGETSLFIKHLVAVLGVSVFAFTGSYLLLYLTNTITPFRVSEENEQIGLDISQHDESL